MEDLVLEWETAEPLRVNRFILPQYELVDTVTAEAISCYPETYPSPRHYWRDYDDGNYLDDLEGCVNAGSGSE